MVKELAEHFDAGERCRDYPWEMIDENKWLAARHGLDGELVDLPSNETRPDEGARAPAARPPARARRGPRLGRRPRRASRTCSRAGTGATRQLVVYEANRDLHEVMAEIVDATIPRPVGPCAPSAGVYDGRCMASSPELFVVCKNCRSQVSPYITECPYCGQRLRKRAPKIERGGKAGPGRRSAAPPRPSLGPLRAGEIPGIRGDECASPRRHDRARRDRCAVVAGDHPAATTTASAWSVDPLGEWWQVLTAPFIHTNGWYQFAALGAIGVFGWLLERRHGPCRSCSCGC